MRSLEKSSHYVGTFPQLRGFACKIGDPRRLWRTGNLGWEVMNERKPLEQPRPMDTADLRNRKSSSKPAKLSREVQARLGQQLRAMYDDVVNQGVPDRFAELINRINGDGSKDRQ